MIIVQRVNTQFGVSMECYSFYSDGSVDLRHGFGAEIDETGSYSGDEDGGEITWDSGAFTTYTWDGSRYSVNGASGAPGDNCT